MAFQKVLEMPACDFEPETYTVSNNFVKHADLLWKKRNYKHFSTGTYMSV